jgi:hypothetical protein
MQKAHSPSIEKLCPSERGQPFHVKHEVFQ